MILQAFSYKQAMLNGEEGIVIDLEHGKNNSVILNIKRTVQTHYVN